MIRFPGFAALHLLQDDGRQQQGAHVVELPDQPVLHHLDLVHDRAAQAAAAAHQLLLGVQVLAQRLARDFGRGWSCWRLASDVHEAGSICSVTWTVNCSS